MIAPKVIGSDKQNGQLLNVRLQIMDPNEKMIFRTFLKDEPAISRCPACGAATTQVTDDMLVLTVESPLSNALGLRMARPNIKCSGCKKELPMNAMDYSAFPSVVSFVTNLRNRYVQLKNQKGER